MFALAWIPRPKPVANISDTVHLYIGGPMAPKVAADAVKDRAGNRDRIIFRPHNVFNVVSNSKPWGNTPSQVAEFLLHARDGEAVNKTPQHTRWWAEFFAWLRVYDITPERIILDNETSFSPFGIGKMFGFDNLKDFYKTYAKMIAPELESYDFSGGYWGMDEDALERIHLATNDPLSQILRHIFKKLPDILFNQNTKVANYNDQYPSNDRILTRTANNSDNGNTWRLLPGGVGEIQAPEMYITAGGNRYLDYMSHAERRWETLLNHLNNLQSMRLSGGPIEPWVAPIGYGATKPIDEMTRQELSAESKVFELTLALFADLGVESVHLWNWDFNDVPFGRGSTLYEEMSKILVRTKTNIAPSPPSAVPPGLRILKTDNLTVDREIFTRHCV
jgi:hypothetical protein